MTEKLSHLFDFRKVSQNSSFFVSQNK